MSFGRFFGGLVLPAMKPEPGPVERLPPPAQLRVPLLQHAGVAAEACVAVGERVARFQRIGRVPDGALGAAVHAPAAGVVVGWERGPVALPGTPEAWHVVIAVAAKGPELRLPPLDPVAAPIAALRERIAEAGIVGFGGAGFRAAERPTAVPRVLILNGVECEPAVASDEALLRERPNEVLAGGRLLARLCGAARIVLALGERMSSALPAVREALAAQPDIELVLLPDRYPADAGLPREPGVRVHNVGTAYAAWRAVHAGEPLVSRFVSVGGDGLERAATLEVMIGTPIAALAAALGGWRDDATVLRAGGPMRGIALPDDAVAVGKTSSAITAWRERGEARARPCIRCGDCAQACPSRLQPQRLHARLQANDLAGAQALGLDACIECGVCDAVCPSAIALTAGFIAAGAAVRLAEHRRRASADARQRFERRNQRLQRDAEEAKQAQATRTGRSASAAAAALAKARAQREAVGGAGPADATAAGAGKTQDAEGAP